MYVDKSGNDTYPANPTLCSLLYPCATIQKALNLTLGLASTTDRFVINVGPGRFDEVGN